MSGPVARLLLVDDDRKFAGLLADYLRGDGLLVELAHDGAEGLRRALAERWDLVMLDVMMPGLDGFAALRRLREVSAVPVLMLTARGGEEDRISGLDSGADDYLPKTVSARELLARVRALLRRSALNAPAPPQSLQVGTLRLEAGARRVCDGDTELTLTPVEFDLLLTLALRQGQVCTREQLLAEVRDRSFEAHDRSIDVHIASLRRKLGDDPPRRIRTVRGAGYQLLP